MDAHIPLTTSLLSFPVAYSYIGMKGVMEEVTTTLLTVADFAAAESMLMVMAIAGLNMSLS